MKSAPHLTPSPKTIANFKRRMLAPVKNEDCIEWPGASVSNYGAVYAYGVGERVWYAHRVAMFLKQGKLTPGLIVMHVCNNKMCCNPEHLTEGTHAENAQARVAATGR